MIDVLRVIKERAAIDSLLRAGLDYSQIAELLSEARREGLVEEVEVELRLTPSGEQALQAADNWIRASARGKWIRPLDSQRTVPLSITEVYLPDQIPDNRKDAMAIHSRRSSPLASDRRAGESPA